MLPRKVTLKENLRDLRRATFLLLVLSAVTTIALYLGGDSPQDTARSGSPTISSARADNTNLPVPPSTVAQPSERSGINSANVTPRVEGPCDAMTAACDQVRYSTMELSYATRQLRNAYDNLNFAGRHSSFSWAAPDFSELTVLNDAVRTRRKELQRALDTLTARKNSHANARARTKCEPCEAIDAARAGLRSADQMIKSPPV